MKKIHPALAFFIILIPVIITDITGAKGWKTNINADGYGYYAYLPAIFIYHHLDFDKIKAEEIKVRGNLSKEEASYPFAPLPDNSGRLMDKYFVGTALLILPFFLLACFLSYLFGVDMSGYSVLFQESVVVAALFYLILGMVFLRKLMKEYGITDILIYLSLVLILYGTNIFYYVTTESSLSHIYTFGLCSIFLFYCKKSIAEIKLKNIIPASLLLGLLFIIRPTNILLLLAIPFLTGNLGTLGRTIKSIPYTRYIPLVLLVAFSVISLQLFMWHEQTGKWFVWNYPGETFTFSHPHIAEFLFSYRKGLFVYTPLILVILLGSLFIFFRKHDYFSALSILLFFAATVYVCSSWQPWWYGGSFGMRPFIDFYPFYALLLAIFLSRAKGFGFKLAGSLFAICMVLSIIQTIQYEKFIFSFDKMNKERYWEVFLKTGDEYGWMYEDPSSKLSLFNNPVLSNDFENDTNRAHTLVEISHNGAHSVEVPASKTLLFSVPASLLPKTNNVWIYEQLWAYMKEMPTDASLIIEVKNINGNVTFTKNRKIKDAMGGPDEWEKVQYIDQLPSLSPDDSILISVESPSGITYLDDVSVRFGVKR